VWSCSRASPCKPSSRTSCLKPADRLGWRAMCLRMVESESMRTVLGQLAVRRQPIRRDANSSQGQSILTQMKGHKPRPRRMANNERPLVPRLGPREVLLFQNPAMMQLMPRNNVSQRPNRYFVLVREAAAGPCSFVEIAQQRESGAAHGDKILHSIAQRAIRKRTIAHVVILIEAFDGSGVAAGNAQCTVSKDAFRVADMPKHLFGTPLSRRVANVSILFVSAGKQQHGLAALLVEGTQNILALNQ